MPEQQIQFHPIGPKSYWITGTWLDGATNDDPDPQSVAWQRLIGTLVLHDVNPVLVAASPGPRLTSNDGEIRLHFDYIVVDQDAKPRTPRPVPYALTIPPGIICESRSHNGESHEVTRRADVVVPREVFDLPDDIEPYIVHDEQETTA